MKNHWAVIRTAGHTCTGNMSQQGQFVTKLLENAEGGLCLELVLGDGQHNVTDIAALLRGYDMLVCYNGLQFLVPGSLSSVSCIMSVWFAIMCFLV